MAKSSIPAVAVANKATSYMKNPEKMLSAIEQPPYKPKTRKLVKIKPKPADDGLDLNLDLDLGDDFGWLGRLVRLGGFSRRGEGQRARRARWRLSPQGDAERHQGRHRRARRWFP